MIGVVWCLAAGALSAQSGRPSTDVWVVPIQERAPVLRVGTPRNLTHRTGYDNQPSFTPDGRAVLYTVTGADAQADSWRITLPDGAPERLTRTAESEYSPLVTPDGHFFSVVRVEADSTQRLWKFPLNGRGTPSLVLTDIKPVGYHLWTSAHQLVLFVLGGALGAPAAPPATLQVADDRTGSAQVVARNIGRALAKVPGRDAVTFLQLVEDSASWISELDLRTHATRRLMHPPQGAEDGYHVYSRGGMLLTAAGTKLYVWADGDWKVAADLAAFGVKNISRLAMSPRGDALAFVADDVPPPAVPPAAPTVGPSAGLPLSGRDASHILRLSLPGHL